MITLQILHGDCSEILKAIPNLSVRCCITSPPYWRLRNYGGKGEIGWESTPEKYVAKLVSVFREVRRILKWRGTLWLNLGDCFNHRQLVGIPWKVAFALQQDGWYLRSDIVWSKPNVLPEPVIDRPVRSHEYIFLLTKSRYYDYNAKAIREESIRFWNAKCFANHGEKNSYIKDNFTRDSYLYRKRGLDSYHRDQERITRNKRSVWTVSPSTTNSGLHIAAFPDKLVDPCILAGTKPGEIVLDPFAGSGTVGRVANRLGRSAILIEQNLDYIRHIKNNVSIKLERVDYDLWQLKSKWIQDVNIGL
jgi:DNA modification methylase